jgi:hypothetical protein
MIVFCANSIPLTVFRACWSMYSCRLYKNHWPLRRRLSIVRPWPRSQLSPRQSIRRWQRAYENNPDLNAARAGLRATDEGVALAKSGYRPTIIGGSHWQLRRTPKPRDQFRQYRRHRSRRRCLTAFRPATMSGLRKHRCLPAARTFAVPKSISYWRHRTGLCQRQPRQPDRRLPQAEHCIPSGAVFRCAGPLSTLAKAREPTSVWLKPSWRAPGQA